MHPKTATARKTLLRAQAELDEANKLAKKDAKRDFERVRQAAEKGWRAAREAVYAVIAAYDKDPGRRTMSTNAVRKFEEEFLGRPTTELQPLSAGYQNAISELHGRTFYEGLTTTEVDVNLAQVHVLIEQASRDLNEGPRGRKK